MFLFELFFSVGFQATVWLIPSEILPLKIRTRGSALSTASNWVREPYFGACDNISPVDTDTAMLSRSYSSATLPWYA